MPDVFSRLYTGDNVGSFSADGAKITFAVGSESVLVTGDPAAGFSGTGLLTQTLAVNYAQQISRIYEIGSLTTFLVAGRTQGTAAMGRVLGPRPIQVGFYAKYGNVCNARENVVQTTLLAGCGNSSGGGQLSYNMKGVVITNLGFQVNANDMIINENVQMLFVSLDSSN